MEKRQTELFLEDTSISHLWVGYTEGPLSLKNPDVGIW